jgi:two-component system cell cycle response regulator
MPIYHYQVRRLEEILGLSTELAQHFPDPDSVQIGIYELLINALEHGNLAIDEEQKLELVRATHWQQEIERRLALPEHRDKHVAVELAVDDDTCRITITDQGEGFDWRRYMKPINAPRDRMKGLGLLMVRHAGFDDIAFNEKGNQVRCDVRKN